MSKTDDALRRFRIAPNTAGSEAGFRLLSSVSPAAAPGEIEAAWESKRIPDDVRSLWNASRTARLYQDVDYGQWGLVLLQPATSGLCTDATRLARPRDFRDDDIVIGEFLGDLDLLVFAPSGSGIRRLLVAVPLNPRSDWCGVGEDLATFLDSYFDAGGDKYWEAAPIGRS